MFNNLDEQVCIASKSVKECQEEIGKMIIGQKNMIDGMLMALIAGGHVLLEGVPGLAKTLAIKTMAEVIDTGFKRVQFTPDLLPSDLIGSLVFRQQTGEFVVRKGPVFSNIILADEINRAPAKVQSALLEAMEEKQITIGDATHKLPDPFFVMATQNPIEQEGTYHLPEAQLDRFLMKLLVDYPSHSDELKILRMMGVERNQKVSKILNHELVNGLKKIASSILIDERIEEYIVSIIIASRQKMNSIGSYTRFIDYGASPRATIYLYRCAKIKALFEGRTFVIPDDVKSVVYNVLRHRIILSYEAESDELRPDDIINQILKIVPVP